MSNKVISLCRAFDKWVKSNHKGALNKKLVIMQQLKRIDPEAYKQWTSANDNHSPLKYFNKRKENENENEKNND